MRLTDFPHTVPVSSAEEAPLAATCLSQAIGRGTADMRAALSTASRKYAIVLNKTQVRGRRGALKYLLVLIPQVFIYPCQGHSSVPLQGTPDGA